MNMELEQKYTEEVEFEIEPQVFASLQEINPMEALAITEFLMEIDYDTIPLNEYVSTVMGGVAFDSYKNPITFALEIVKTEQHGIALSDVTLISMDEYLDLINLNLKLERDEL